MYERALILGATGMIGAHAVRACLRQGIAVRALVRPRSERGVLEGLELETVAGDLADRASLARALKGCDLAIHAAAPYPKRHFGRTAFLEHARAGIANLLAAASTATHPPSGPEAPRALQRLVYVSSATTIGRPPPEETDRPARESDTRRIRDDSPYFAVKFMLEEAVERAVAEGLPAVIVNPTFCVDAFDAHATTAQLMLPLARRQLPAYIAGHLNAVATRDVGEGIVAAAVQGRIGRRYILGGENMTSRVFLERCAQVAGVPPPRRAIPTGWAEVLSLATEAVAHMTRTRPLFPLAGIRMMKHSQPYELTRARKELGYQPTSIDAAITRAYDWYRRRGWLPAR